MTIDEAIAQAERIAEGQEKSAELSPCDHAKERISKSAAEHRQLAAWLRELKELKAFITGIYQILGEHFEYPCSNEVAAELMKERSTCFDCGGEINNEECWRRFFTTMIGGKDNDS